MLLKVNQLDVKFNAQSGLFHAVKGVHFNLKKGETVGIVGESGSGKSVTSLALMRLLNAGETQINGEVLLDDIDLLNLPEKEMQAIRGNRMAMIFQEPMTSLNPVLTCGCQVIEAIRLHFNFNKSDARKKAIELFNEV
jgi:peptide/nickel transport system ATP-binding protein